MPREEADESYLWDMLEYCRQIESFVQGRKYHDYVVDKQLRLAIERCIEIIGEAARNVSHSFQASHPEVPWRKIIAQRHVLAHEYGEIKHDRIWVVATQYVPALIQQLIPFVPPAPPNPESEAPPQSD